MPKTEDPKVFASKMISFKEEVIKLCKDHREGRVYKTGELVLEDANTDDIVEASCVKDITDVSFISLGPVYVTAQVPYSFLDQYCGEVEPEQFLTIQTPEFMTGLEVYDMGVIVGSWGDKINALNSDKLEIFTDFMCSQVLSREGKLYGITFKDAMIQDPVLRERKGISPEHLMRIRLFLPYTVESECIVNISPKDSMVSFTTQPSSPELKKNLRAAMIAQKEKEI